MWYTGIQSDKEDSTRYPSSVRPVPRSTKDRTFLRQGIVSGNLPAGTRLPAVRRMAVDLQVNRITVENAYARLEADGLIAGRQGSGTYVLAMVPAPRRRIWKARRSGLSGSRAPWPGSERRPSMIWKKRHTAIPGRSASAAA
jgi:DNA-binding transcriptional MocR family regulator